jgi:RHS repeat-associated protein
MTYPHSGKPPLGTPPAAINPAPLPVPSLPKGGGAGRGIGETFSANPVTGTVSLQVPIATSPGHPGVHPALSLDYDSGVGNGPYGHGVRLSVPQITRRTEKGIPQYRDASETDTFVFQGVGELCAERSPDGKKVRFEDGIDIVEPYQPRHEGLFARIEKREDKATHEIHWRVVTPDNATHLYGKSPGARIAHPEDRRKMFSWLLEATHDDKGNVVSYEYKAEDLKSVPRHHAHERNRLDGLARFSNRYLKRIRYGNTVPHDPTTAAFEVVFDHGEHDAATPTVDEVRGWPCRQDPFSTYRSGFEIRTYRLCRRVLTFHRMAELGDTPCLVGSTELTYAEGPVLTQLTRVTYTGYERDLGTLASTKEASPPIELGYSSSVIQTKVEVMDRTSLAGVPGGVQGQSQWVDLDGEGLPGVLTQQAGALFYKRNLGEGRLAPAQVLFSQPSMMASVDAPRPQISDIDGDGNQEILFFAPPMAGYHERREDGSFSGFRPFLSQPRIDWNAPNVCFIDLSGDGHLDVLVVQDHSFTWYPSLAKGGFDKPFTVSRLRDDERAAAFVFADGMQTIFLADMTGDGLTDIVRIRNGNVCYWPNLGYGGFGAKVQMEGEVWFDNRDQFDPRRIRLADVDGSGTTDILYLQRDGIRIYANQSGNTFAAPIQLPRFPDQSDLSTITVMDLLGTGTACVVWSSALPGQAHAPVRYIDLLGSTKPYLLTSVKNNLGLTRRFAYAPSTKFYRQDAAAGTPWVTKLPFPVQVLTRVETYDAVARHHFVTTYAYHHGYYDGVEREFRGFGMVETWDAESFLKCSGEGALAALPSVIDPELHLPPVYTKTWFHTGAWKAGHRISQPYEREYYKGDAQAARVPDSILPSDLTVEETREACRALHGQVLRQEVYALDGSAAAPHPSLVSERNYEVRRLQPAHQGTHGVFFAHPREAIETHSERNPSDPRISHELTLEVDDYGTVRRSAAIGYPRRAGLAAYPEQQKGAVTLTEVEVFHHAAAQGGWHRLGVPIETRSYALTGLVPREDAILSFEAVHAAASGAMVIPYEATADGSLQKRLLSQVRQRYWQDDLSGPLDFGAVESLALPYQTYTKAFTPALLTGVFGARVTDAILAEGGYVQLPGDDAWWAPSGRQVCSSNDFYLPIAFIDPFGNTTSVTYDAYRLFVTQVIDPAGNVTQATYDYRALAPSRVTDPNGNRSAARFDALGRVTATAVMGKVGAPEGDTLDDPTTKLDYGFYEAATGRPSFVQVSSREQHGAANPRWQESYNYSDGSGHEVMRKVQAEPGLAPARDANGALVQDADGKLVLSPCAARWVGSGRTVFDNKGNPVKQYEPFFSSTHAYEDEAELVEWGVTPSLRYDPLGRLVRTDLPNGTFSKVAFDPWKQTTFDPNDTVLESRWYQERQGLDPADPERRAADLTAAHANTLSVAHLDALGRTFLTVADNGTLGQYSTHVALDIEGNPLVVTDARQNEAERSVFGMGGRKLCQKSSDAGERWLLADVTGKLLRAWDARGFTQRKVYDALRRATHLYVQKDATPEILAERTVYGEALSDAAARNLRGKVHQAYDSAGVVTSLVCDFQGNLLQTERRLAKEYRTQVDWSVLGGLTDTVAIEAAAAPLLEAEVFAAQTAFDALNRPTSLSTPDQSEIRPTYNEASLLERVEVRIRGAAAWTTFVDDIDYDAKGQRERIVYGNGTRTIYTYDPLTFRLIRLKTVRDSDGAVLQNLSYTYDPVGNITEINDSAQQEVFFNNDVVSPRTQYVYDALYRLIQATGREHAGAIGDGQRDQNELPLMNLPHANDAQALRRYVESYDLDEVGNILELIHQAGAGSWTRRYAYEPTSNRLVSTSLPGDPQSGPYSAPYAHDAHGNMTSMPHLANIGWDFKDQMRTVDLGGGGTAYYVYDAAGQRVRKVIERLGTLVEERIYLGGFEVYRKRDHTGVLVERETLHVMDGARRIALVETETVDTAAGPFTVTPRVRYQLGNHLGSAVLELDEGGLVISYEEYHPYGTTAYRSARSGVEVSEKRYRYTGKERDEETGLYYHGARYYAPWLGRWTSCDPAGMVDGPGLYTYVRDNPVRLMDPSGTQSFASPEEKRRAEAFVRGESPAAVSFETDTLEGHAPVREGTTTVEHVRPEKGTQATPPPQGQEREPGFWERVDKSRVMRVERALVTSLANIPNTFAAGLLFIGLGLTGHVQSVPSEDGGTMFVPDETAQTALAETAAWRITPRPGTESLSQAYDVVLPLVGAAVTGGSPKPGAGLPPAAVLGETKETVSIVGAEAADATALAARGGVVAPAVEELVPSLHPERALGSTPHPFAGIPKELHPQVFDIIGDLQASRAGNVAAAARLGARDPHPLTGDLKGWTSLDIAGRSNALRFLYRETSDGIKWMVRNTH